MKLRGTFTGAPFFTAYTISVKVGLGNQTKWLAPEMTWIRKSSSCVAVFTLLWTKSHISEKLQCLHLCVSSHHLWLSWEINSVYLLKDWHFQRKAAHDHWCQRKTNHNIILSGKLLNVQLCESMDLLLLVRLSMVEAPCLSNHALLRWM